MRALRAIGGIALRCRIVAGLMCGPSRGKEVPGRFGSSRHGWVRAGGCLRTPSTVGRRHVDPIPPCGATDPMLDEGPAGGAHAPLAQLDRASDYESEGRLFESARARSALACSHPAAIPHLGDFPQLGKVGCLHSSFNEGLQVRRGSNGSRALGILLVGRT